MSIWEGTQMNEIEVLLLARSRKWDVDIVMQGVYQLI